MQNLDQIRAAAADKLLPQGQKHTFDRSDVVGIPALILSNGLLAAAAFCCEQGKDKRSGMRHAFDGIAKHLQAHGIATPTTEANDRQVNPSTRLISDLATKDSLTLQRATTEALAFLSYLKRFALKKEKKSNSQTA